MAGGDKGGRLRVLVGVEDIRYNLLVNKRGKCQAGRKFLLSKGGA